MVKMEEMTREELIREAADRYKYLMLLEDDYDRRYWMKKEAKTDKEGEKIDILLKMLRIMRQVVGREIEELMDFYVSQVSDVELDENLKELSKR